MKIENITEKFIEENRGKKLCELFAVDPANFTRNRIEDLDLSVRAYNCLSRYLDPPLLSPTGAHFTVDELLNLTLGQLKDVPNLGKTCFLEVLEKLNGIIA